MDIQQILPTPMPSNVTVNDHGTGLTLNYRWYSPKFIFLIFFCIFWDGFLFVWYGQALSTNAPLMMILFPLLHVGVGVGLTYYTVAGFLNRTVVEVSHEGLRIYYTPLPWFGNKTIPVSDLAQLYREEVVSRGNRSTRVTYQLSAVSKESKKIKLLGGIETTDVALFLEQEIEKWLGIKDVKVAGEMQK
jgi:hypothetical protein